MEDGLPIFLAPFRSASDLNSSDLEANGMRRDLKIEFVSPVDFNLGIVRSPELWLKNECWFIFVVVDEYSPFLGIEKSAVLQEARVFNDPQLDSRRCSQVILFGVPYWFFEVWNLCNFLNRNLIPQCCRLLSSFCTYSIKGRHLQRFASSSSVNIFYNEISG